MVIESKKVNIYQQVRYIGTDQFGLENEHTGTEFVVVGRKWDEDSQEYLFNLRNTWSELRENVPFSELELL